MTPFAKTLACSLLMMMPLAVMANPGGDRPPGPPPEAIEACADLAVDDTCTFEGRHEQLTGTCMAGPEPELPLACAPDGHRGPPRR